MVTTPVTDFSILENLPQKEQTQSFFKNKLQLQQESSALWYTLFGIFTQLIAIFLFWEWHLYKEGGFERPSWALPVCDPSHPDYSWLTVDSNKSN